MARTKAIVKKSIEKKTTAKPKKDGTPRKPRRWKPGTVAKREIKKYQRGGKHAVRLLIPRESFNRVISELLQAESQNMNANVTQISPQAKHAIRVAGEEYLQQLFKDSAEVALVRQAETVSIRDFKFAAHKLNTFATIMRNAA